MDWYAEKKKKHIEEAKSKKLTLVGSGADAHHRRYKFDSCGHIQEIKVAVVRRNNPRCHACYISQIKQEAKALGLVWIEHIKGGSFHLYECKKCKTKRKSMPSLLRKAEEVNCKTCLELRYEKEANKAGLRLMGKGTNNDNRRYKFNKCSHVKVITLVSVRNKTFHCKVCYEKELKDDAKKINLIFKGNGKNKFYKKYKCKKCKHEDDYKVAHVKAKSIICKGCLNKKHSKEARSVGLEIVGKGKTLSHRTYRFKQCKHEQQMRLAHVRNGNFICHKCEETSRDLPSNVYLLRIEVGSTKWLKLGYAKTIRSRVLQYKLPEGANVERLKVLKLKKGRDAHLFESSIHKKHSSKKLSEEKMKKFHKNGYNECYPMKMLDTLMEELDSYTK